MNERSACNYDVLNPWAEVDPKPLDGISPRVSDLANKKIGLCLNDKRAGPLIMTVVERKLRERLPSAQFHHLKFRDSLEGAGILGDTFEEEASGLDAIITAVGD